MGPHLWLRTEVKANEHRTALTPDACRDLLAQGFSITVEKSNNPLTQRCYPDAAYADAGCTLVEAETWPTAPSDAFIVGLKELPESDEPLIHRHIYFGHAYKNQGGWKELLRRFAAGKGTLLDMEYLTDDSGRRVAAFGYMAGFAGSFVGLDMWCQQQLAPGSERGAISAYPNEETLLEYANDRLLLASAKAGRMPRIMVMGALGRCGTGACDLATRAGVPESHIVRWDMEETKAGGPFEPILDADIFINCIYLSKPIPPFITEEMLARPDRALSVIVDVSADTSNPHNPLPFANKSTTFDEPFFAVTPSVGGPVHVSTIDHLPTLLPKESSDRYCDDLLPSIKALPKMESAPVWQRAIKLFEEKVALATACKKRGALIQAQHQQKRGKEGHLIALVFVPLSGPGRWPIQGTIRIMSIRQIHVTGKGSFGMVLSGNAPTVVTSLDDNSPAAKEGIVVGDAIVQLDGVDAAMFSHKQVIEEIRPFVNSTLLFGVIQLTDEQLKQYRERVRQLMRQRHLVRRWSASSMTSAASLALSLSTPASPVGLNTSAASHDASNEPEEITSRPIAGGSYRGAASGPASPLSATSDGVDLNMTWPQKGPNSKRKLISMRLMDDALGEEARAQKRHEEDLAALRGGSGSSVAAAAAAPSSQTRAVVPAHNIVATGKPKAQPKRHDYETFERDDKPTSSTSVGDAEEQQHSTVAAPAKRADSWLEQEDKSLPMASGPTMQTEMSWRERERTLPPQEHKKAASRTRTLAKRFAAAQEVYETHLQLAHMAAEGTLKKSDKARFERAAAQQRELEKQAIACPTTITVGGRVGAHAFLNCTLRRLVFLDGRPVYASKGTVALQHGARAGKRIYLYYDEAHSAWVLDTEVAAATALAFCPDTALKPDLLRKPWYVLGGKGGHVMDEAIKLRRGGSRKRVSFNRKTDAMRIQGDGSLSDSQPDLLKVVGMKAEAATEADNAQAEADDRIDVFVQDGSDEAASASSLQNGNLINDNGSAEEAGAVNIGHTTIEHDIVEQDHVEQQDYVEQDHVEQDHVEQDHVEQDYVEQHYAAPGSTDTDATTYEAPAPAAPQRMLMLDSDDTATSSSTSNTDAAAPAKPPRKLKLGMTNDDDKASSQSTAHQLTIGSAATQRQPDTSRPRAASAATRTTAVPTRDSDRRWSMSGSDAPSAPASYPTFDSSGAAPAASDTFVPGGDAAASRSAGSSAAGGAAGDDPFAYLNKAPAAKDGKKRKGSGRKDKSKSKAAPTATPAAADDPFAYLTRNNGSGKGSGRGKKK